jgi:hypothetical protein
MSTIEVVAFAGGVAITLSIAGFSRYLAARRSGRPTHLARYVLGLGTFLVAGPGVYVLLTDAIGSRLLAMLALLFGAAISTVLALVLPRRPWAGDPAARARLVRVFWILALVQLGLAVALIVLTVR